MAASTHLTEPLCRLCHNILTKKQRRTIFSESFGVLNQLVEIIGHVPSEKDNQGRYVCSYCWNKLNRLSKIENDIKTKLEALKTERQVLIGKLRELHLPLTNHFQLSSEQCLTQNVSPNIVCTPKSKKHVIIHSPTPRKTKKPMIQTPIKNNEQQNRINSLTIKKENAGQKRKTRIKLFSPHKVKVLFMTKGQERNLKSRIIPTGDLQTIVRRISQGQSHKQIAEVIFRTQLKEPLLDIVIRDLKNELKCLLSTNQTSYLRKTSGDDLATFKFDFWIKELQLNAPVLYKVLNSFFAQNQNAVAVTAAIIMKQKNMHMSAFHHVVSQILDNGGATDECINILNKLGLCVSASSAAKKKADLMRRQDKRIAEMVLEEKRSIETNKGEEIVSSDIVGDNFDISKCPSHMSKEKQRKSWHWFMLIGLQKRVFKRELDSLPPVLPITDVENSIFLPNVKNCQSLEQNFIFHIMKVLVKYLACFKKYEIYMPEYIEHPHIKELSQKSDFAILDLLDKNENKSEDMISILEHIHSKYIPHTTEEHPHILKKTVFGGDVLTNERAYSAQVAMLNGVTDFEQISGVIHRPEGLHRMMNLCLVIYQQFYKASSVIDRGTLSQLRNKVHRVDVYGSDRVVENYRPHFAFIEDCLDAFIVGACLHLLDMKDINSEPLRMQVLFEAVSTEEKIKFLKEIATEIQKKYINLEKGLQDIETKSKDMYQKEQLIKTMFDSEKNKYFCSLCHRSYMACGHLKNHLAKEHGWNFVEQSEKQEGFGKPDRVALYRASFMKCALLLRDTRNAYDMGDGNRILDNAKFQMVLSGVGHHSKYQLWLFRFLAYYFCLLSPREAYEYKWNCTTNLKGGVGHNIPNDSLVEILVHKLKVKVQAQGANFSFESVRKAAMSLQIQNEIKENMIEQCGLQKVGTTRSTTLDNSDITLMVNELVAEKVFDYKPG